MSVTKSNWCSVASEGADCDSVKTEDSKWQRMQVYQLYYHRWGEEHVHQSASGTRYLDLCNLFALSILYLHCCYSLGFSEACRQGWWMVPGDCSCNPNNGLLPFSLSPLTLFNIHHPVYTWFKPQLCIFGQQNICLAFHSGPLLYWTLHWSELFKY